MLHTNRVVHVDVICLCTICKRSCYVSQWISLREMKEVHTAVFLKFWLCSGTGIPYYCHVGLSMQRNLTESWVRSRLYKACNVLNTLLTQYSNVCFFSANIIRVQFFGGKGGACSLNGLEYTYVQERKISVDSYSGVMKDSSCQGSDTERFMKFIQSQMIHSISSCCLYP